MSAVDKVVKAAEREKVLAWFREGKSKDEVVELLGQETPGRKPAQLKVTVGMYHRAFGAAAKGGRTPAKKATAAPKKPAPLHHALALQDRLVLLEAENAHLKAQLAVYKKLAGV